MATVITAGNATNGLSFTADNTGALEFKTGTGAGTTAITVDASQVVTFAGATSIPGNLSFNSGYGSAAVAYGCRAWVNFNGTGTIAIRASGNVTSLTDNGTGDYTVNFTTAMPDANYCVEGSSQTNGSSSNGNGNSVVTLNRVPANALAVGSVRICTTAMVDTGTVTDCLQVCVSVHR